jgi:hypothetical protein
MKSAIHMSAFGRKQTFNTALHLFNSTTLATSSGQILKNEYLLASYLKWSTFKWRETLLVTLLSK